MNCDHDWELVWTNQSTYVKQCQKCREIDENISQAELYEQFLLLKKYTKNEYLNMSRQNKLKWVCDRIPPMYSSDELDKLKSLFGSIDILQQVGDDYWAINEPTKIDPTLLTGHPQNALIYGLEEDISLLISQIKESGWIKRLTINLDGQVVGGNRRLLAIKALQESGDNISTVDIEIKRFVSKEEELRFLILDNASREKSTIQKAREARSLKLLHEIIKKKQKENIELTIEETQFSDRFILTKSELEKKGRTNVKGRDILAKQVGLGSGHNLNKSMLILQVIDFLRCQEREQEAVRIETLFNEKGIETAYREAKEWVKENPTDWIYTGEDNPGVKCRIVYSMLSNFADKCWVDFGDGQPREVFRSDLILPPVANNLKLKEGDSVVSKESQQKGVISRIENDKYVVDWENDSLTVGLTDKDLIESVSFKLQEIYSDGNSIGLCTFIGGCGDIGIRWLGMGDSPAPKDFYEVFSSSSIPSLQVYRFDPTKPPKFVNESFMEGDKVKLRHKLSDSALFTVVETKGAYVTIQSEDRNVSEVSSKALILIKNDSFILGDQSVKVVDPVCFPSPSGYGTIVNLFKSCADVRFGKKIYRLNYLWLKSCQLELDLENKDSKPVGLSDLVLNCQNAVELEKLLTDATIDDLKDTIKSLWLALKK